jgi:5-deoxy-5-amino-3-dehydroquinate synthase
MDRGRVVSLHRVRVPLGDRAYDVVVGPGAIDALSSMIDSHARRALVVTQRAIPLDVAEQLQRSGLEVATVYIGQGEEHKSLATITEILDALARLGATRRDVVVGVGGGMVTDVAGFAASLWHRGMPVVHVSTTLVGMVDAAIGGKTGVNVATGKNLVGSFWQPSGVVCDTDLLRSLPPREIRCGNGEMAKYHFLAGDDLLSLDEASRIARCVAIKAEIVAADEREGGRRALLNYGHTLAHALEIATDFTVAHGEAVAIGLVFAARLAHRLGRIPESRVDYHRRVVVEHYGLATELPLGASVDELLRLMHGDKKALDGLTFVLDGPAGCEVVPAIDPSVVRDVLAAMEVR